MNPYWSGNGVELYLGRCEAVLPALAAERPLERGVVMLDTPYSPNVHEGARTSARPLHGNAAKGTMKCRSNRNRRADFGFAPLSANLRSFCAEWSGKLAARWVLAFCDDLGAQAWRVAFGLAGLEVVRTGYWHKLGGAPQMSGDRPGVACEEIIIAHAMSEPNPKGKRKPIKKRWNGGGNPAFYEYPIVLERGGTAGDTDPRFNETEKPLGLMVELVQNFSEPGELLYDFTAGGGTLGVAALITGRRAILIEEREAQCEKTKRRLEAERTGARIKAERRGQIGLFA